MFCPKCGQPDVNSDKCPKCGVSISDYLAFLGRKKEPNEDPAPKPLTINPRPDDSIKSDSEKREYYRSVIERFPNSPEAVYAKQQLEILGKGHTDNVGLKAFGCLMTPFMVIEHVIAHLGCVGVLLLPIALLCLVLLLKAC